MKNLVSRILFACSPTKVSNVVIRSIAVKMPAFFAFWTRTYEYSQNKGVHVLVRSVAAYTENDEFVSIFTECAWPQLSPFGGQQPRATNATTPNAAIIPDLVPWEAFDIEVFDSRIKLRHDFAPFSEVVLNGLRAATLGLFAL